MTDKHHIQPLKVFLEQLGSHTECMFDSRRYNSKHLYNLLEKWHTSDAYITGRDTNHPNGTRIRFDAGDGRFAYIQFAGLAVKP